MDKSSQRRRTLITMHRVLLHDRIRMDAYRRAIRAVVRPGDVVADLGTGTGVLAFEALAAGAAHVHAVEVEPRTLAMARHEAARHNLSDRITFYRGLSQRVRLKERVNVVITETLGNLGLNENILAVLADARRRWLKRGGTMIPKGIALTCVPLGRESPLGRSQQGGLPSISAHSRDFLSAPIMSTRIEFGRLPPKPQKTGVANGKVPSNKAFAPISTYRTTYLFPVCRSGSLHGFAGWFTVWLTDAIHFATAPTAPATHWQQALLPLHTPLSVRAGQRIRCWLQIAPERSGMHSIVSYDLKTV